MAVELNGELIRLVCDHLSSIDDVINYSLVDKHHYECINGSPDIWIRYLKKINVWSTNPVAAPSHAKITPINCLSFKTSDPALARERVLKIWDSLNPLISELLIKDNSNFQSMKTFQKFNTPQSQASLLTNLNQVLPFYRNFPEFKKMGIKLDTLMNMFINSIINEIKSKLDSKDYETVNTLINSLDRLQINSNLIDPLESLIEFFYERYGNDYSFLLSNDEIDQFFIKAAPSCNKRGIVNGYEFSFSNIDLYFERIMKILDGNLLEINDIFHSAEIAHHHQNHHGNNEMDEVPIVLKVLEHFLSNYLVGVLIDRLISKSKEIDLMEEPTIKQIPSSTIVSSEDQEEDIRINIINENSLFFQCVPYIHFKLTQLIKGLKYPKTEITLDDESKSQMDYVKVGCQLVNYCFENYLIEFTNELPLKCKASLFQLIDSWQSKNANIQRGIEHEIMKFVEDDSNDDSKFNFEIFSTFSNMFNFKKQKGGENSETHAGEVKLSKVAARLKILTNKVETLKSLVSMDLVVLLLQHIKNSYDLLIGLTNYSITDQLRSQINQTCINIFNDMLMILINKHIKPGFNEALERLKTYDPMLSEGVYINGNVMTLEPLTNFIELVDVGDLILQMVGIFYEKELISTNIIPVKNQHSKDFLKMNVIEKSIKLLESSLDNYVATGLDVSIMIIINEIRGKIEHTIGEIPLPGETKRSKRGKKDSLPNGEIIYGAQYPPPTSSHTVSSNTNTIGTMSTSSTAAAATMTTATGANAGENNKVYDLKDVEQLPMNYDRAMEWVNVSIGIMETHFKLLNGSIEKGIMDAFKQEIGDRFISLLIQLVMGKFVITTIGGVQFSFDVNYLYGFYQRERIRPAIEYLVGFKKVDQIYMVECSGEKGRMLELGRMVIDVGRDNGVFTPEEVYGFATRRSDWLQIKRQVDKIVYGGFGVEDCCLM